MSAAQLGLVRSYRHLYREGLRAIKFSAPARFELREKLRTAFRKEPAQNFDEVKIQRTLEFLRGAARERGLEHKILRNLLLMSWHDRDQARTGKNPTRYRARMKSKEGNPLLNRGRENLQATLDMLNESMGLCLR